MRLVVGLAGVQQITNLSTQDNSVHVMAVAQLETQQPSSTEDEVFQNFNTHSGDLRLHFLAIQRRIAKKRQEGRRLSSVERLYEQRPRVMERALQGPSLFSVCRQVLTACIRPLPLTTMLALIVLAEASSSALFTDEGRAEKREKRLQELAAIAPAEEPPQPVKAERATKPEVQLPVPEVSTPHAELVAFITGVISVYRPQETNAGTVARMIVEASHRHKMDPLYIASVIALESSFRTKARSRVGALGLMQVMPATAEEVARKHTGHKNPTLTDPQTNIELGITYLKQLEAKYRNRDLALRAYNWGPANVDRAQKGTKRTPESVRAYSQKILERTLRWNKHFERATTQAAEMNLALAKAVER